MLFTYIALGKDGTTVKDEINASSYHEAVGVLHSQGLIPTELKEKSPEFGSAIMSKISRVSLQDKILFIKNLSIMLKAGVPLTRALKILSSQTQNAKFKNILTSVYNDVESGKSISQAFMKYPGVFKNIFISMFKVGEMSGNLEKNLEYLGIQLQREHDLKSKTKGAMIYPAVIVFAIVIVGILMSIFVLPSLVSIFKDSNIQLPLTTRIVIAFVDFMHDHTFLALGGLVGFIALVIGVLRTKAGTRAFDKILLRTPVFGEISKKVNLARFSRTMSSMLKSGTPILESLQIAADSLDNTQYRDVVMRAAQDVRLGKTITSSLSQNPRLFNYLITQMIGVGEESGNVDAILEELAEHYEMEVDDTMRNISSIIEPVLILVIGGVVGLLAVALIGPIYSLTGGG